MFSNWVLNDVSSSTAAGQKEHLHHLFLRLLFFLFFVNVYLFLRERETEHERGRSRERDREGDTEFEAGSRLRAVSTEPDAGLELTDCEIVT